MLTAMAGFMVKLFFAHDGGQSKELADKIQGSIPYQLESNRLE